MAGSMHMPIGTKYCCGMIEIYPSGEFTPIKGHGYDSSHSFFSAVVNKNNVFGNYTINYQEYGP